MSNTIPVNHIHALDARISVAFTYTDVAPLGMCMNKVRTITMLLMYGASTHTILSKRLCTREQLRMIKTNLLEFK